MSREQGSTTAERSTAAGSTAAGREIAPAAADGFSFAGAPAPAAAAGARAVVVVPVGTLWTATAVGTAVLTAFLVLVVSGTVVTEGPVVAALTPAHGVHVGDLCALAAWCLAVGLLVGAAVATTVAARRR